MNINNKLLLRTFIFTLCFQFLFSFSAQAEEIHTNHSVGLFLGGTHEESEETDFTIGAEYEYHFHENFAVGGVIERTPDAHDGDGATVALGVIHAYPTKQLHFLAGVGREMIDGHDDETLYRLGVAYDIEIAKSVTLAPNLNVDFVDGKENFVFGAILSRHF